jgi:HPr kinase/phosphorylase
MSGNPGEPDGGSAGARGQAIHATAIVVGEAGVVIRGASGAGKSSIALAALDLAHEQGRFARLVGDDRVLVRAASGRVIVSFHPAIAGKIERRSAGILDLAYEERAIVRLVADIVASDNACGIPPRLPEAADRFTEIAATRLPRVILSAGAAPVDSALCLLRALPRLGQDR